MAERVLRGLAASPGIAGGAAYHADSTDAMDGRVLPVAERPDAAARAVAALRESAGELAGLAQRMRMAGRHDEADMIEAAQLIAGDPVLEQAVGDAVLRDGCSPGAAIGLAIEAAAAQLDALEDATLAERASDVRSVGRRALRLIGGGHSRESEDGGVILIANDLGPADVAELGENIRGVVLGGGGLTGHAAIVARSLGLPMVVRVGAATLTVPSGEQLIVDGDAGTVSVAPPAASLARLAAADALRAKAHPTADTPQQSETVDGRRVRVLANVAGAPEVTRAVRGGAEGVGLVRTELAFLDAVAWPSADEQRARLEPLLAHANGLTVCVRLFDFGADKTPPFLRGTGMRGIDLLLSEPAALATQVRTILDAGRRSRMCILVPMVRSVQHVRAVRCVVDEIVRDLELGSAPAVGAMIEAPEAVAAADAIAAECDLLSIGTNDLASMYFGVERTESHRARTHHPAVLRLIAHTVDAARAAGIGVEVCGEAASDPLLMPLVVGLGVDELSVGVARIAQVRSWVAALRYSRVAELAQRARESATPEDVEHLLVATRARLTHLAV